MVFTHTLRMLYIKIRLKITLVFLLLIIHAQDLGAVCNWFIATTFYFYAYFVGIEGRARGKTGSDALPTGNS